MLWLLLGCSGMRVLSLVISHGLHCVDQVREAQSAIVVRVVALYPALDVIFLDFVRHFEIQQERAQVITRDFTVGELINRAEDRQDRVVELIDKLLFKVLDFFHRFNLTIEV